MLRRFAAAFAVLALCVGVLVAGEYKAKVTKVEVEGKKKIITVSKEGAKKDTKINVGKDVQLVGADGKDIEISDIKEGAQVVVTTEQVERTDKKTGEKKKVDVAKKVKLVK